MRRVVNIHNVPRLQVLSAIGPKSLDPTSMCEHAAAISRLRPDDYLTVRSSAQVLRGVAYLTGEDSAAPPVLCIVHAGEVACSATGKLEFALDDDSKVDLLGRIAEVVNQASVKPRVVVFACNPYPVCVTPSKKSIPDQAVLDALQAISSHHGFIAVWPKSTTSKKVILRDDENSDEDASNTDESEGITVQAVVLEAMLQLMSNTSSDDVIASAKAKFDKADIPCALAVHVACDGANRPVMQPVDAPVKVDVRFAVPSSAASAVSTVVPPSAVSSAMPSVALSKESKDSTTELPRVAELNTAVVRKEELPRVAELNTAVVRKEEPSSIKTTALAPPPRHMDPGSEKETPLLPLVSEQKTFIMTPKEEPPSNKTGFAPPPRLSDPGPFVPPSSDGEALSKGDDAASTTSSGLNPSAAPFTIAQEPVDPSAVGTAIGAAPAAGAGAPGTRRGVHYCTICNCEVFGDHNWGLHLASDKHKRKEVLLSSEYTTVASDPTAAALMLNPKNFYKCEVCNVVISGQSNIYQHINGLQHQRNSMPRPQPLPADCSSATSAFAFGMPGVF